MKMQMNGFQIESGAGLTDIDRGPGPESSIDDTEEIKKNDDSCFIGNPGSLKQDPNCLCKKANNCKQMEMPKVSFNGMSTPGILSEPMSLFQSSGNKLYSGDLQGAQADGARLGNFAGKIKKAKRQMFTKVNKSRKNANQDPIDFGLQSKALKAKMVKMFQDGYSKLSPSDQKSLQDTFSGNKEDLSLAKELANRKQVPASGVRAKSAGQSSKTNAKDGFMGFDFGDQESTDDVAIDPDSVAANMNDQGMFQGDIRDRPDEDIFKIINTRYLKSAYPIFFDEEGGAPPQKISE